MIMTANKKFSFRKKAGLVDPARSALFVLLFMTVFSQSFFSLMRGDFVSLTFFTTRHVNAFLVN
jgi:hypothetical protein